MTASRILGVDIDTIVDGRERLLYAGLGIVINSELDLFVSGIQPDVIALAADRSRRNFYDHFESKDAFILALFERFLLDRGVLEGSSADDRRTGPSTGDFRAEVRTWFTPEILEHAEVISWFMSAGWPASAPESEMASIVEKHNLLFDEVFESRYEVFLREWGLELAPAWTPLRLATVVRAVTDGIIVRYRPSRGEFTEDQLYLLVEAIIGVFAAASVDAPIGLDPTTDVTTSLVDRLANRWRALEPVAELVDVRQAMRQAFLIELKRVPHDSLTLGYLADRAGVATPTALRVCGSVSQLAEMVLHDFVSSIESSLERDESACIAERVRGHLLRIQRFGYEYQPLIRTFLAFRPVPNRQQVDPIERLVVLLAELIEKQPSAMLQRNISLSSVDVSRMVTLSFLLCEGQDRGTMPSAEPVDAHLSMCVDLG